MAYDNDNNYDDYDYDDSFIDDEDVEPMEESSEDEEEVRENKDPMYYYYAMMIRTKQWRGWKKAEGSYYWRYIFRQLDTVLQNCGHQGADSYRTTIYLLEQFKQKADMHYDAYEEPIKGKCFQCKLKRMLSHYVTLTKADGSIGTFSIGPNCLGRLLLIKRVIDLINNTANPTEESYEELNQALDELVTNQSTFGG